MELFSKIFNSYFIAVKEIIRFAQSEGDITFLEIESIIQREAFLESHMYVLPNLLGGTWPFLEKLEKGGYISKLNNKLSRPLTELELMWFKAISKDRKFKIFFTDEELDIINNFLKDVEPLFDMDDIIYFDQSKQSDPYDNPEYRKNFKEIIKAFNEERIIKIRYMSSKNKIYEKDYIPIHLEYSEKDDVFRLFAKNKDNLLNIDVLRVNRIIEAYSIDEFETYKNHNKDLNKSLLSSTPVVLRIKNIRNSLQRTMLQFANYKKQTEYDDENNYYICKIWYNHQDETDLLIRILSFGYTVEIISPKSMRERAKKRIEKQFNNFYKD